jgi:hypothetical protein
VSQAAIITDAARLALLAEIEALGIDIESHIQGGLEKHDAHEILNVPYQDSTGHTLSSKTLKIGVTVANVNVYILLPANP